MDQDEWIKGIFVGVICLIILNAISVFTLIGWMEGHLILK